jgi:two-component system chemotaxis response regulator CheY
MAYNVLVVDDSAVVRAVIARTLGLSDVDVGQIHQAANGREALDVLEREWIDIVFADINMPEMNGIELVDRMHESEILKTIPVVVVSTERSTTRIRQLRAKGVSAYLNKPFTPEGLREAMEGILGR